MEYLWNGPVAIGGGLHGNPNGSPEAQAEFNFFLLALQIFDELNNTRMVSTYKTRVTIANSNGQPTIKWDGLGLNVDHLGQGQQYFPVVDFVQNQIIARRSEINTGRILELMFFGLPFVEMEVDEWSKTRRIGHCSQKGLS